MPRRQHRALVGTDDLGSLATAHRGLHQLSRQVRRDLRSVRLQGESTAIVARSNCTELAVQSITRLAADLHSDPGDRNGRSDQ
ncbi:hypothetical protein [Streptomyces sp. NPDC097610]|uniref:hypothetical protein n=1 Tax=Streptomyces sp. NPDC097610 TaxID=3157227 RepID=UPI0033226B98